MASIADSKIIGRRDASGLNRGLLGVSPVIVRDREKSAWTVQLQHRVSQRIGDAEWCQRRANRPEEHMFRVGSGNDKPADADIIPR